MDDATSGEAGAERAACAACDEQISVDAGVCPECDNNPRKSAKWASVGLMVVGILFVWIPFIGIPVFLIGLVARVGMRWTDYPPTKYSFG